MTTVASPPPKQPRLATRSGNSRRWKNEAFRIACIATAFLSVVLLAVLLSAIVIQGLPYLAWDFLWAPPSPNPARAGIGPALFGTIWVCAGCALFTLPIGVGTAIFLEEFKPTNRVLRMLHGFVQLNITNLAGVPSVVYGIIGLTAFVGMFGLIGSTRNPGAEIGVEYFDQYLSEGDRVLLVPAESKTSASAPLEDGQTVYSPDGSLLTLNVIGPRDPLPEDEQLRAVTLRSDAEAGRISQRSWYYVRLPLGRGVMAGSLTLMLVVLPIVIISTQESLRAVPDSLREGALGMGATRWQVVRSITLPAATPGVMTGSILAMSRAIGEAAPILIIAGILYISAGPKNLMDDFSVMPLQIYNWAQRPQVDFHEVAASGILVLLGMLLSFNAVAIWIRHRMQKPLS